MGQNDRDADLGLSEAEGSSGKSYSLRPSQSPDIYDHE